VFERAFDEQRRALVGWVLGLAGLGVVMLGMYPSIRGNRNFSKILEAYPQALRTLFGLADYTSGPGYLRAEIFSLTGPLLFVIFAVLWGSDLTAGEEERRTVDILLANPVSRRRVVVEKWAAMVVGIMISATCLGAVLALGGPVVKLHVGLVALSAAVVSTALLAVLFGSFGLAVGTATGRRGLARGVTALAAVVAYLLSSLPELVSWLRPARPLSPWYHALGVDPLSKGYRPLHLLVLLALVALCLGVAVLTFERRDLAT
jgi:ABC-2 type transport system permease protein